MLLLKLRAEMKAVNDHYYHYNKRLRPLASGLRKNMTKAEACLWKYVLRAGMMKGYTFNRQRSVVNFVADFLCKELRLVIEVDGITHQWEETKSKDRIKEAELEKAGFKLIRFTDDEVLMGIGSVRETIERCVEKRETELGFAQRGRSASPISPSGRGTRKR